AFAKSLAEWKARDRMPPVLFNHDWNTPIGCYTKLVEDERGLYVEGKLLIDQIEKAREMHALLQAKAIDGLSIGYSIIRQEYDREADINKLIEVKLYEISVVIFPANPEARVDYVKHDYGLPSSERFKALLMQNGFNAKQAAVIHDSGFFSLSQKATPTNHVSEIDEVIRILGAN
ncbi:HK97 family phage prohead protease, partial [Snodgrassella alvi]